MFFAFQICGSFGSADLCTNSEFIDSDCRLFTAVGSFQFAKAEFHSSCFVFRNFKEDFVNFRTESNQVLIVLLGFITLINIIEEAITNSVFVLIKKKFYSANLFCQPSEQCFQPSFPTIFVLGLINL